MSTPNVPQGSQFIASAQFNTPLDAPVNLVGAAGRLMVKSKLNAPDASALLTKTSQGAPADFDFTSDGATGLLHVIIRGEDLADVAVQNEASLYLQIEVTGEVFQYRSEIKQFTLKQSLIKT